MRQKTITLYQFDELPTKQAKEKAREWLRECESGSFSDFLEMEPVETAAPLLGITFDERQTGTHRQTGKPIYESDILWSGFYSPGDGASFKGRFEFRPGCAELVRAEFPTDEKLHAIADGLTVLYAAKRLLGHDGIRATITSNNRNYVHSGSMGLDDAEMGRTDKGEDAKELDEKGEEILLELMRDFANWIYAFIRAEYDYRTSDEALDETMQANEYEFDEDGERV